MDKKVREIHKVKPKLNRRTKRMIKRKIDKDIKAGKYDYLKSKDDNNS
jgi:hypothetical protein